MIKSQTVIAIAGIFSMVISTSVEKCGKTADTALPCSHPATVRDFAGLDGCQLLLEVEGGEKLLAVNLDDFSPLKDGQTILISYEKAEEMMSICMAEDLMVRLTCLATKVDGAWKIDCPEMIDPYRVAWAEAVMQEINPRQVDEIILDGQRAYLFYAPSGAHIYSCTGELLCTYTYNTMDACKALVDKITESNTIYVVNE